MMAQAVLVAMNAVPPLPAAARLGVTPASLVLGAARDGRPRRR
ncbi:hypothetical protein ACWCSD_12535 [Nonomuraea sp. NPDC001684]